MELFDEERAHARPAAAARPAAPPPRSCPMTLRKQRLYDLHAAALPARRTTRGPRRSPPDDFELRDDRARGRARRLRDLPLAAATAITVDADVRLVRGAARSARLGRVQTGRIRCRASAAPRPPTHGRPTRSWSSAYGDWYRPAGGPALLVIGDALLRRTRGRLLAGAPRRDRPARAGARRRRRRRHAARRPGAARPRGDRASSATAGTAPTSATSRSRRWSGEWAAVVFWHSLEHLPEPGEAIRARRPAAGARRASWSSPCPNTDSLQARVFGDRWLHLDLPRHLVHLSARALRSGLERPGFASRAGLLRPRRPDRDRLARRAGRRAARATSTSTRRCAGPQARSVPLAAARQRAASIAAACPAAAGGASPAPRVEVALRRSGTVYVEARRA